VGRKLHRYGVFFAFLCLWKRKLHRHGVFFAFLCLWKEATSLWCFFRISLLVEGSYIAMVFFSHFFACGRKRHRFGVFFAFLCLCKETLAKKAPLPPFPEKGVSPPKGGRHSRETHSHGYGHRRQSRLSAGKMEMRGQGFPVKGMFGGIVWKGPAQPRNSLSWVLAPTAKPSECRQDGNAGARFSC